MLELRQYWLGFVMIDSILESQKQGTSLGEECLAGREPCQKVPRSSQQVSGCCQGMLAGRGIARWASRG
ncbi:hypothetical protein A2U01_0034176 [Trifolium medium]|uniref:Uncharacterized protein n=1 Tax=Trifolium medium TaxID=97028 RepID=A0A392PMM0_9FABA|nr:hypothetical protein [Trifolium medium]